MDLKAKNFFVAALLFSSLLVFGCLQGQEKKPTTPTIQGATTTTVEAPPLPPEKEIGQAIEGPLNELPSADQSLPEELGQVT